MKKLLILLVISQASLADDALINPVAKKIKSQVIKTLNAKGNSDLNGFCDLMLEMRHSKAFTKVHRVKTHGDAKLCKLAKKAVPKTQYRYQSYEKFIRIQITF
jgi:predicted secreted protein